MYADKRSPSATILFIFSLLFNLTAAGIVFSQEGPTETTFKTGYLVITPDPGTASPMAIGRFDQPLAKVFTETEAIAPNLTDRALVTVINGDVGLALVNPNDRSVTVTLEPITNPAIVSPVFPTPKQIELAAFHQVVKFVQELMTSSPPALSPMISIASTAPISIAVVKFRESQFSRTPLLNLSTGNFAVPVRNGVGGPGALVFPIFTQSEGFASSLFLVNPTATTMTGRVDVFDSTGNPLSMNLNGQTASTFRYSILGRFLFTLHPSIASFRTLEQGNSGFFPSTGREILLINTQAEWEAFYARHSPNRRPPEVDFSKRSIVVAIASEQMVCQGVEITEILPISRQAAKVRAIEQWMGRGCTCILIVAPPHAHIVVTEEKILSIVSEWDKVSCVP